MTISTLVFCFLVNDVYSPAEKHDVHIQSEQTLTLELLLHWLDVVCILKPYAFVRHQRRVTGLALEKWCWRWSVTCLSVWWSSKRKMACCKIRLPRISMRQNGHFMVFGMSLLGIWYINIKPLRLREAHFYQSFGSLLDEIRDWACLSSKHYLQQCCFNQSP